MIPDFVKVSDARVQSLGLKFTFVNQQDKLIITAFCSKENMHYLGTIDAHPLMDFDDIKEVLEEGQFKTLIKTEELLKIKFGATSIELISKSKAETQELKDSIKKLFQRQIEFESTIKSQKDEIQELKTLISDLRATVQVLKSAPNVSIEKMENMKGQFTEKFNELEENLSIERNEVEKISKQTRQIKAEGESSKRMLTERMGKIEELGSKFNEVETNLRQQVHELRNMGQNLALSSNKLMQSMRNDIVENRDLIDEQKKKLEDLIQSSEKFHSIVQKLKDQIQNEDQEDSQSELSQIENDNSLPQQTTWSQILKADLISINGNVATNKSLQNQGLFCLLDAGFTNTLQQKQSWAIKIKNKTSGIGLGICLKNQIQNNNFTAKGIKWNQTGHGLYLINSKGYSYSHSQQEFNYVLQGFQYGDGVNDVIFMEYDPIDMSLRFNKNKEQSFEIPIIPPPQDDEYHPYVSLRRWNESVELILPSPFPK